MTNSIKNEHTTPLFRELEILKFYDIYRYFLALRVYRNQAQYAVQHTVNTRGRNLLVSQYHRLTVCQHAVSYAGPKVWNEIPSRIREISTMAVFKRELKKYFLNNYQ